VGVDFLKSKCKKFSKGWDVQRLNAALSKVQAESAKASEEVVARTVAAHEFRAGDEVTLRADGDRVSIVVDLVPTAIVEATPDVTKAILESGGYARGTIRAAHPSLCLLSIHIQ
jgi:hypothetical protein